MKFKNTDGIKIRVCDCVGGYYGDVCTLDNCTPDPCNGHGTCNVVDNDDGYECDCDLGYQLGCLLRKFELKWRSYFT